MAIGLVCFWHDSLIGRDVQGSFINDLGVFEHIESINLVNFKIGVTSSIVKIKKTDFYSDPSLARLGMSFLFLNGSAVRQQRIPNCL